MYHYYNSNTYTYWVFYESDIIENNNNLNLYNSIYAYTDSKKIANRFINERNMKKFILQKKEFNTDEINILTMEIPTKKLNITKLDTSDSGFKKDYKLIEIALTDDEKFDINNLIINIRISLCKNSMTSPYIFKKKYIKSLNLIKYIIHNQYVSNNNLSTEIERFIEDSINFDYDLFAIFIYYYGKSLKE